MKLIAKVMAIACTMMIVMTGITFAMWKGTISESTFQSHVKAAKFAIFVKDGSTITMYEPSSPSLRQVSLGVRCRAADSMSTRAISPCGTTLRSTASTTTIIAAWMSAAVRGPIASLHGKRGTESVAGGSPLG